MQPPILQPYRSSLAASMALMASMAALVCPTANAITLNAPVGGTFTMNLDSAALAPYYGYFLSEFWDAAASDPSIPTNTGPYLVSQVDGTEISAINRVFPLTPIGPNPTGQAGDRHVQGTSANFSIDSDTLAGVVGAQVGMAGVQGFYAPLWLPNPSGLVNGDFSVLFDTARQTDGRTGWYLANNIYFSMAVYELSNLNLAYADANNWQMSGNLLMSPENGGMLKGAVLNDVGDFCLGTGSYSGCGQVSAVPLPTAAWLFGSALLGLLGIARKKPEA